MNKQERKLRLAKVGSDWGQALVKTKKTKMHRGRHWAEIDPRMVVDFEKVTSSLKWRKKQKM